MSDSSSVDRWHPSNVEWPDFDRKGPLDIELDNHPEPGYRRVPTLPLESYEALYADRGRVLAAARELAEAVAKELDETEHGWIFNYANPDSDAIGAALAAFREVDHG